MERKLRKCKKITRKQTPLKPEEESDAEEGMARQRNEAASSVKEPTKDPKRKKPSRERWLLTRKTWRYMTDAGRRLIPEGAQNRAEDIPKLEAYFQEVCQKEKKFLLWRKSSYPGALNFRTNRKKHRDRKKWGSYREKTSTTDECEQKTLFDVENKSGGRFDIQKLRQQFLDSGTPNAGQDYFTKHYTTRPTSEHKRSLADVPEFVVPQTDDDMSPQDEEKELMESLLFLLSRQHADASIESNEEEQRMVDYTKLLYQLKRYLSQSNRKDSDTLENKETRGAYNTPETDFSRPSRNPTTRTIVHPIPEASETSHINLKNRKGLRDNDCEESSIGINLRNTPQTIRDKDSSGYDNINLRKYSNVTDWSTDGTRENISLKSRGGVESSSQHRYGATFRSGKPDSHILDRSAPVQSPVTGHQNTSGTSICKSLQTGRDNVYFEGDHLQKLLVETLRRYYNKSGSRDKVISDILTDRKLLEKLYFDLRKARNFKGRSGKTEGQEDGHKWESTSHKTYEGKSEGSKYDRNSSQIRSDVDKSVVRRPRDLPLYARPPIIEVEQAAEPRWANKITQTSPISQELMAAIEDFSRKEKEKLPDKTEEKEEMELKPPPVVTRRRSSVDHDDVSPSVSDTIKRYLKMARKKSVDADKVDRFKRVNYDRNLRNIKPKGEISKPGDDDGLNKGCQTDETWVVAIKDLKMEDVLSEEDPEYSRSRMDSCRSSMDSTAYDEALLSPPSPVHGKPQSPRLLSSGQSFLSSLLHGLQHHHHHHESVSQPSSPVAAGAAMQKSKSSSSVVHHGSRIVSKKIWRTRSKSQSRAVPSVTSTWTPQGQCVWSNVTGAQVTLTDTCLVQLTDLERRVLQKVALAKLQALNLGVAVRVPSETVAVDGPHKPKRRAHLLKRKALTTSFFDTVVGKTAEKDKADTGVAGAGGLVFGIPISQCLENDRLARGVRDSSPLEQAEQRQECLRRMSHHGSRTSFSSLTDSARPEEAGSCESLVSPADMVAGSVPGLLNTLSGSCAADLAGLVEREPGVPSLVTSCFRHLETHGLNTLGIFRVSSSKKRVRQLRELFDSGKESSLEDDVCPHDVATLIKEFFRDLPEPLLCRDLYHAFVQTQRIRNRRLQLEALQHLVHQLPVPNRDTLWALLAFLSKVSRKSCDYINEKGESVPGNKMDSSNLATLFAPNILHRIRPGSAKDVSAETQEERVDAISAVRVMIDHHEALFTVSAELLDEVYLHMMDSHPEALDYLLRKRGLLADKSMDELESIMLTESRHLSVDDQQEEAEAELDRGLVRRVWSREEFLHESAGMGGPDVGMRPRHKERTRLRYSKKHWWEDGRTGAGSDAEGASSDTGSSVASSHLAAVPKDSPARLEDDSRRRSTPVLLGDSGSVITASLKIPVPPAAPFSREDPDIGFMEDLASAHRQVTVGVMRTTRHRHFSTSGSDSSAVTSQAAVQQEVTSTASSTSPPPSSWPSTPPNSPDGTVCSVDYIPEQSPGVRQQRAVALTTKEITPVILHKVTFASAPGEQRVQLLGQPGELPKSASTSAIARRAAEVAEREVPPPASISSIGGAVMRSKTADIERILRIHKPAAEPADKYSKRRYTDSRHNTRHIPDCEALEGSSGHQQIAVYKRRELIASDPKDETFL